MFGPLELIAGEGGTPGSGKQKVYQRVYLDDGGSYDRVAGWFKLASYAWPCSLQIRLRASHVEVRCSRRITTHGQQDHLLHHGHGRH